MLQPWLEEVSDLLELFFLPPYSPDLNGIEMLWKKTRRNVTHNRFFKSLEELCRDLTLYWKKFENPNEELKQYIEEVFTDYNDINEYTRMQLELINETLAELQN